MRLTAGEITKAVGGTLFCGNPDTVIENISTASGEMKGADLFVPIIGARVDAHRFIGDAFAHGAAASFSQEGLPEGLGDDAVVIGVKDTLGALQALGAWYRSNKVRIPYIGVTGSVGKTTTREMIAAALSAAKRTYSTKGNANSQTGVPITVTETPEDAEIGVIEMGISEFGEMQRISAVVQCDMAVVTVIGISHIANLGSRENIMKEKLHILDGMRRGGALILNGDDSLLKEITAGRLAEYGIPVPEDVRILFYGTGDNADIRAEHVLETGGCAEFDIRMNEDVCPGGGEKKAHARLSVPGTHMMMNALAAAAAAVLNGVDLEDAVRGLEQFEPLSGRGKITVRDGITVINDAYNAAPQSMTAGLKVLNSQDVPGKRIAVLADMLELGPEEERYHREVGTFIAKEMKRIDEVLLYGKLSERIAEGIREAGGKQQVLHYEDRDSLAEELKAKVRKGDAVFFKGSNSMKLAAIAEQMTAE